eukprot:XP_011671347.1 PREDICTED: uncharacterized protein LOC105441677 [Strongylocentrotus purpuratus]
MAEPECVFCHYQVLNDGDSSTLTQKGCDGIKRASADRGIDIETLPGQKVHKVCRLQHICPMSIAADKFKRDFDTASKEKHTLRSVGTRFQYNEHCLFCGTGDNYSRKKVEFKLIPVRTFDFQASVVQTCLVRSDKWAVNVKARIDFINDLHAAGAVYHQACSINFRTHKQIPQRFLPFDERPSKKLKLGRPQDQLQTEALLKVVKYFEKNDEEQNTIHSLVKLMGEYLKDTDAQPYSICHMKKQLKKYLGDKIIVTEVDGNSLHIAEGEGLHDIVTMRERASEILRSYFKHQEGDEESQKKAIIETAARLIKSDIKTKVPSVTDQYPSSEMLKLDSTLAYIPETLHLLLDSLFVGTDNRRKVASIGQAIIQAVRPRATIVPLQIGLGVQTHHLHR